MDKVFFDGWETLLRTLIVGVLSYVVMVTFLRIAGKRTLSKMNAFDLIVTVALGSTLATMLLSKDVSLAEGALAFALLISLQFLVTWSAVRVGWVKRFVTGEPQMLLHQGTFLPRAMRRSRVTEEEIRAAVRGAGSAQLEDVEAVVLETDGSFSVVVSGNVRSASSLSDVLQPSRSDRQEHG